MLDDDTPSRSNNRPCGTRFVRTCSYAKLRGYPLEDPSLASFFTTWVHSGISYASISYAHLESPSLRVYVALYAAFLLYIDDTFASDVTGLATFHVQFCRAESHGNVVLDFFSSFLRDTHAYFDYMAANIIITGALNFVTGLVLEHRMKTIKVITTQLAPTAKQFPKFARGSFAAADACSIFIFPPDVSVESYIQALPEMINIITHVNDVLSFYKEELAGDENTLISFTARSLGVNKNVVLRDLANEVIETDKNVRLVLASDGAALRAYNAFVEQYVAFHRSLPRYRLNELTEVKD
ncbi:isoprenoid synthase domain-containing protein [Mucidula mucida]|nr:isoprenoid synthase domain-containing protein [Mucidula mucida]